ncbi:MAG: dihydrofolate reductase family protein [Gammaproteobacteria bacterium]|nr:dihydrofolate reductase family protein [Gammaproteobacteria bacterium]
MNGTVTRLHPAPREEVALQGLYLRENLHRFQDADRPFIYANFVASLDGRISLGTSAAKKPHLPSAITSDHDLRLLFELQAQADCLVTHGGYLRALAAGRLGNVLHVGGDTRWPDISDWRRDSGLAEQPDIVIVSASLKFPIPDELNRFEQRKIIATGSNSDPRRVDAWRERGFEVVIAGSARRVEGAPLATVLAAAGYGTVYLLAGPTLLSTLIRDGCVSRLYLTITHQLLGGDRYDTLTNGPVLGDRKNLKLRELYYDASAPAGAGQWFAQFVPGAGV